MYTVYSKPNCPQCVATKTMLTQRGYTYKEVVLDISQPKQDGVEYISRDELLRLAPGAKTMPQIFKDGIRIGGYSDVVAYIK